MKPCRIRSCSTPARSGQLMCREHWYQLPAPLRRTINSTWRARQVAAYVANVREAERLILGEEQ